jgi:hypothetical protein
MFIYTLQKAGFSSLSYPFVFANISSVQYCAILLLRACQWFGNRQSLYVDTCGDCLQTCEVGTVCL